jgi:hypothetical protein
MSSPFMWDDAEFSPLLSEGMQAPMAVGLSLLENVRGLRATYCLHVGKARDPLART